MPDVIERHAVALFEEHRRDAEGVWDTEAWSNPGRPSPRELEISVAALQAALDPTDEALVEIVARAIGLMDWYGEQPMPEPSETALRETNKRLEHFSFHARAALLALRSACSPESLVPNESPNSGECAAPK